MRSKTLLISAATALLAAGAVAVAQVYPSPTYQAVTILGDLIASVQTGHWGTNNGGTVQRLADQVFVGGATKNSGDIPPTTSDWFSTFESGGGWTHIANYFDFTSESADESGATPFEYGAILGAAESKEYTLSGAAIGGMFVGVNNLSAPSEWFGTGEITGTTPTQQFTLQTTAGGAGASITTGASVLNSANVQVGIIGTTCGSNCWNLQPAAVNQSSGTSLAVAIAPTSWGAYAEDHCTTLNAIGCIGLEVDLRMANAAPLFPNPVASAHSAGIQDACGAGWPAGPEFNCPVALQIGPNPMPFNEGINFVGGGIADNLAVGMPVAIGLPETYGLVWFNGAGTSAATISADSSAVINLNGAGIKMNGAAGVTCGPGVTSGNFTVVNGIVTHC